MDDVRHEYDLEERTFQFALAVRSCIAGSKWTRVQWTDVDQLLRSSGSIAANKSMHFTFCKIKINAF